MDSDKENYSNPSSAETSPVSDSRTIYDSVSRPVPEEPRDISAERNSAPQERLLKTNFPDFAALLERLQVLAPISGLGHDVLDPITLKIEKNIEKLREYRLGGESVIASYNQYIAECTECISQIEEEILPILSHFKCGLPTEQWHAETIASHIVSQATKKSP